MKQLKNLLLGASVKTTLTGYGTAAAIAAYNYAQALNGQPVSGSALVTAVGVALLGRFAKDHNVTNAANPATAQTVNTPQ